MSSSTHPRPLFARGVLSLQHPVIQNLHNTYTSYEDELQENLCSIMRQFPHLDKQKVTDLLEELGNNCELAIQMIEQEEKGTPVITEGNVVHGRCELALTREEKIRLLKTSFLNLHKKFTAQSREVAELRKGLEQAQRQNAKLKELNRVLLEREYSEGIFDDSRPIF